MIKGEVITELVKNNQTTKAKMDDLWCPS